MENTTPLLRFPAAGIGAPAKVTLGKTATADRCVPVKRRYRSRAEVRIAGLLDREGIAYRYEHPLAVVDQNKTRIWYPDFCLPEYGMILEYFGINGDAEYDRRTEHKMRVYETTGVEGVFLN
jgi:hypothetical protein